MSWFKVYGEMIDDPKIRLLSFEDRWHYVALMCCKHMGIQDEVEDLWEALLQVKLGLANSEFDSLKERLLKVRLIDENWNPTGWDKRQTPKDPKAAARQAKFRAKQKKRDVTRDVTGDVTEVTGGVTEGVTVTSREEERIKNKEENTSSPSDGVLEVFEAWWKGYPRKQGKQDALKLFRRLSLTEREEMLADDLVARFSGTESQYIPHGDRYVRSKKWMDDVPRDENQFIQGKGYR